MTTANGRKSIFITGAASGMGLETARLFSKEGWFVGGVDVNAAGLDALKAELGEANILTWVLDVTDRDAYAAVLDAFAKATDGKLDLLFNNAGIGRGGPFIDQPWQDVMDVVNINFVAVLSGIHLAAPLLKATPNSLCFTTSSSSAIFGIPNIAVYSATKHAVKGLTEALSVELRAHGVRAADTLPGMIDTPILPDEAKATAPTEGMWRLTPPREVAEAVWGAYHSNKIHWYVPSELEAYDAMQTQNPEAIRDQMLTMGGLFSEGSEKK
ncbi:SDR family oxidoreductase [Caulobacter sp. SLTY]|jgi:NAD(P)-dependent dehydrogenase (short-subunit alcohol dehydrogenase family)|uniref:SDR family oxidoreductase n=1 Tax=Caulobacter sp. SLTY TaxID=2683262 RepID=UPI001413437E|nr:SDR family oxidoreductase [Caulobacter sp. SLTY]NBB16367.1 SDR family oxidoreductase [Caulobacter sp. SLTY]